MLIVPAMVLQVCISTSPVREPPFVYRRWRNNCL